MFGAPVVVVVVTAAVAMSMFGALQGVAKTRLSLRSRSYVHVRCHTSKHSTTSHDLRRKRTTLYLSRRRLCTATVRTIAMIMRTLHLLPIPMHNSHEGRSARYQTTTRCCPYINMSVSSLLLCLLRQHGDLWCTQAWWDWL